VPSGLSTPVGGFAIGVAESGKVGVGTTTPSSELDVEGEIRHNAIFQPSGGGAETAYEVSTLKYIIEAAPAQVGIVQPINHTILKQLCKDKDGCRVTIQMVNWDTGQPGNIASRQEHFFISETSNWWRATNNDVNGLDNNGGNHEWSAWDCYFTDSENSTNTSNGRTDSAEGFGLLNARGGSYSDANVTCRIVVED
jgi:hypothetical protein